MELLACTSATGLAASPLWEDVRAAVLLCDTGICPRLRPAAALPPEITQQLPSFARSLLDLFVVLCSSAPLEPASFRPLPLSSHSGAAPAPALALAPPEPPFASLVLAFLEVISELARFDLSLTAALPSLLVYYPLVVSQLDSQSRLPSTWPVTFAAALLSLMRHSATDVTHIEDALIELLGACQASKLADAAKESVEELVTDTAENLTETYWRSSGEEFPSSHPLDFSRLMGYLATSLSKDVLRSRLKIRWLQSPQAGSITIDSL